MTGPYANEVKRLIEAPIMFGGFGQRKRQLSLMAIRLAHLQEDVIALNYLTKVIRGDAGTSAGDDIRFHYNTLNESENARVFIKGFYEMIRKRDDYIEHMNEMLEDIDRLVTGSIFTPREELAQEIRGLMRLVYMELTSKYEMSQKEYDELIGEKVTGQIPSDVGDQL